MAKPRKVKNLKEAYLESIKPKKKARPAIFKKSKPDSDYKFLTGVPKYAKGDMSAVAR